jgi:hypothetical protein
MPDYISPAESNENAIRKSRPKVPSVARRQQAIEFSHKVMVPPFMDDRAIAARMVDACCSREQAEKELRWEWLNA